MTFTDPSYVSAARSRVQQGPTWPWALGSLLVVCLVFAAMLVGRALVSRTQEGAARVAAPNEPLLAIVGVAHPAGGVQLLALDDTAGRLAVLTTRVESPACPPTGACPASARPDAFALLDGASGATVSSTPLTGRAAPAADASQLLIDASQHVAYAISSHAVVAFSTQTGAPIADY